MPVRKTLAEFQADCRKASEELDLTFRKTVRTIILTIVERTAMRTPIKTGRASGSWYVSTSSNGGKMLPPGPSSPAESIERAESLSFSDPYSIWYIYNNLPYIARLEYEGYSMQAPQGMLRITMAEVATELKSLIESGSL